MVVTMCQTTSQTMSQFEDFQPCCCPHHDEEEFYHDTPSEDPWKELLPTPPHSPKHDPFGGPEGETTLDLKLVSDKLDARRVGEKSLQSNLIQDCMWSAPGLLAAGIISTAEWTKAKPCENVITNVDNTNSKVLSTTVDINTSECVDPAAVFPYPLNDHKVPNLGTETPSESESSGDELDNEDEEIDVVSVTDVKPHMITTVIPRRKPILPASSSMSAHVAAIHNYSNVGHLHKRIVSYSAPHTPSHHIPSHGLKRSRPSSSPVSPQPSSKKQKLVVSELDLRRVVQKLEMCSSHRTHHSQKTSSRSSSDSEDGEGKRAQHNVLERKRRNDLKSSFLRLRDNVPGISTQERAPKVIILKKAADFVNSLTLAHKQFLTEREHQRQIHEKLKRRLTALNRESL